MLITKDGKRKVEGYCTDIVTDLAIDWLKETPKLTSHSCLCASTRLPHRNWMPPERYLTLYDDRDIPVPSTLFDRYLDNASCVRLAGNGDRPSHEPGPRPVRMPPRPSKESTDAQVQPPDMSGSRNFQTMTDSQKANWEKAFGPKNRHCCRRIWRAQTSSTGSISATSRTTCAVSEASTIRWAGSRSYLKENGLGDNTIVIYSFGPGLSTWAITVGTTSAGCTRNRSKCRLS